MRTQAWLLPLLLLIGCSRPGLDGPSCAQLDEASCRASDHCTPGTCNVCGHQQYAGCYNPGVASVFCPAIACQACAGLDESACAARPDCKPQRCPGCSGDAFVACGTTTDPPLSCPALKCTEPCNMITNELDCAQRNNCHAVYADRGVCDCSTPGCCIGFSFCADGRPAVCYSMVSCDFAPPPACGGPYVTSYVNGCYEGCVLANECAPTP